MTFQGRFTAVTRRKHYARRTEWTCRAWIMALSRFHRGPPGWRRPSQMGAAEVEAFLTHRAVQRRIASAPPCLGGSPFERIPRVPLRSLRLRSGLSTVARSGPKARASRRFADASAPFSAPPQPPPEPAPPPRPTATARCGPGRGRAGRRGGGRR
ncbi:MAG: phage integrase N-terminal SAM-like domain-containing protein [Phycisphaeraceae bacterium]|nr:phage integrase N-terminal SAM-like domain-containing protein [Phycisphaeraceae bacterium]